MSNTTFVVIIYLLAGYLLGLHYAPELFSSNVTQTHWENSGTYEWLVIWPYYLAKAHII